MRTMGKIILAALISQFISSCNQKIPAPEEIEVTWELISNTYHDEARVMAEFTIRNNSGFRLNDHNWALFYSQAPRRIIGTSEDAPAEVKWINGDWHKIVPKKGFRLGKGGEVKITYEASGWWIKYSDAPMGLYFVFYDRNGNEKAIITADNYTVKPFERKEQFTRHRNDHAPAQTPQWRYDYNLLAQFAGEENLKRIIPTPVHIRSTGKYVVFQQAVDIIYQQGLKNEADQLANILNDLTGQYFNRKEGTEEQPNTIFLRKGNFRVNGSNREAYRLEVRDNKSIVITGTDNAGVFYGIQSLIALMPVDVVLGRTNDVRLEVLTIEDAPRFHYRGLHIDVARNFQPKDQIKKVLDLMAFYKLNTLHFHLTEDEGWRLEIRDLPELTKVGGQRQHSTQQEAALQPAYGSGPFAYAEGSHGSGYYSHEDFVEILRYATARHIRIIPEVNLPGHARAAIKAMEARYQRFMEAGDEEAANEFRLIDPEETSEYLSAQFFTDNIINVARESVYRFFETVVDGVIAMYEEAGAPLEIFHTGGDEVPVGVWTQSPMIDELLKTMPEVGDPKNLQAYFFERAIAILRERNLKIGGWQEVAMLRDESGRYTPNPAFADGTVIPYIWNSLGDNMDLGYQLANMGYPIVQCNVSNFYFDLAYDSDPMEPGLYWAGFVKTRDAWYHAPFNVFKTTLRDGMGRKVNLDEEYAGMERLNPDAKPRVLGLQAQLWSETILGKEMLEYYMLPKLIGLSESAWAQERSFERIANQELREAEAQRKWNVFASTLAMRELPRLSRLYGGFNYRLPLPGAIIENQTLKANVEYPGLIIRYTTDGEEPTTNSPVYTEPVSVSGPVKLKAFDIAGRSSRTVTLE